MKHDDSFFEITLSIHLPLEDLLMLKVVVPTIILIYKSNDKLLWNDKNKNVSGFQYLRPSL